MSTVKALWRWRVAAIGIVLGGCRSDSPRAAAAAQPVEVHASGAVDSAISIEAALARFRRGLPVASRLHSAVASRDELVRRIVAALSAADTSAMEGLAVNRAEYAWLYYPSAKIARPPYELPPALAWFQLQEENRQGAFRALRELGGRRLAYEGYRCAPKPVLEGENRVWTGCFVSIARDGGPPASIRLFGAILEREGRFEVLSYDNDF